ncbi:MAG: hypothetical protein GF409_04525 [Candidatus Omnitrophica bacterium]|nr:hypothetical protein [Candidatus Omnitrophota bacterium]
MLIVHDKRLPEKYTRALSQKIGGASFLAFEGVPSSGYESIRAHPDIYFFQLDRDSLVHSPSVPDGYLKILRRAGVRLIKGAEDPGEKYPYTAPYNAVRVGDAVFCNSRYTDPVIKQMLKREGLRCVDVKQGYARCSVIPVSGNALITADRGIAEAAGREGFAVLLVTAGAVVLPGEKAGFLGGAAGVAGEKIFFLGSIETHPDSERMKEFLRGHSAEYRDIESEPLYDAGSIMLFQ